MSSELEQLQLLNEKIDRLNVNIERLIGLLATQSMSVPSPSLPSSPALNPSFTPSTTNDIASQVQAKIAAARAAAEKQIAQARSAIPNAHELSLPKTSVNTEE